MRAQVRVPWVEAATYLPLVPAIFLPLVLATAAAPATLVAIAATTAALAALLVVQRVVVGDDYVAVRRLRGYRVVPATAVTAIHARPSQRGGALRIDVANARPLRLRHVEAAHPRRTPRYAGSPMRMRCPSPPTSPGWPRPAIACPRA